jgi:hypothetical protein
LTPKTTTINLEGYEDIFGESIVKKTDLDKIMVLNANTYNGGTKIQTMMNDFVNKYEKLAIKIKTMNNGEISAAKVPSQNIVVLTGKGTLTISEENDLGGFTKPFTLIIDGINIIVK